MKKIVPFAVAALLLSSSATLTFAKSDNSNHSSDSIGASVANTVHTLTSGSVTNLQTGDTTTASTTTNTTTSSTQSANSTLQRIHGLQGLENALQQVPATSHAYTVLTALLAGQNPSTVAQDVYGNSTVTTDAFGSSSSTQQDSSVISGALQAIENDTQDGAQVKKSVFDTLAQTLEQDGDLTQALQAANDSVATDPTDSTAFQNLANLYNKTGDSSLKIYINGKQLKSDLKPFIKDSRTLVPLRAIAESLGATVNWDNQTRTITITKDGTTIILQLNSNQANVNGTTVTLDVPANSYNGYTFVPARFVSEGLGQLVKWVPGGIVNILSNPTTATSTTDTTTNNTTTANATTSSSATGQ